MKFFFGFIICIGLWLCSSCNSGQKNPGNEDSLKRTSEYAHYDDLPASTTFLSGIQTVSVSPDMKYVAMALNDSVLVISADGERGISYKGSEAFAVDFAWSSTGQYLVSSHYYEYHYGDPYGASVVIMNVNDNREEGRLLVKGGTASVAISSDDKILAVSDGNSIVLYSFPSLKELNVLKTSHSKEHFSIRFIPGTKELLACGDAGIEKWNTEHGEVVTKSGLDLLTGMIVSPDGNYFAVSRSKESSGEYQDQVMIFDRSLQLVSTIQVYGAICSFSPDSRELAVGVGGAGAAVCRYNVMDGKEIQCFGKDHLTVPMRRVVASGVGYLTEGKDIIYTDQAGEFSVYKSSESNDRTP